MKQLPKVILILVVMTILGFVIGGLITFAASYQNALLSDPPNAAAFAEEFQQLYWLNLPGYLIIGFASVFILGPILWCYVSMHKIEN